MTIERAAKLLAFAGMAVLSSQALAQSANGSACTGVVACMETRDIIASVTDFRSSLGSNQLHIEAATIHFTNKSNHPVILGYVNQSGVATDDQGNRFAVLSAASVRGIGIISGNNVDTKFSLQPGESADTRFELGWRAQPNKIFGTSWTLELSVREINQVAATQVRLGDEFALHFAGLRGDGQGLSAAPSPGVVTGVVTAPASGGVVAQVAQTTQAVSANACAGAARCYDAGAFSATIASMAGSKSGRHHVIDMTIRFRNTTTQPIILAYTQKSSALIDNLGNRYYWGRAGAPDHSVNGMGFMTGSGADPQFVLQPGESRDAKFSVIRFDVGNTAIGTSFTYDVSLEQLQILASQQIRPVRQYAVHFENLQAGGAANVTDAVNKLKGLFKIGH